ncbi:restriction endonuclease subunit S [Bacillus atrophaeus]|uniref:restriction endonuclease subunit S n=1 Tax=Bacillus atrophaeus TaxID=1452 RepID=UPI00228099D1|nr:restriction endonuclease subunit S [Bacillus atrophaeus]MCY8916427.1 restriction endonuclease subunit S [Bacillus atrophaeus]MCY8926584.1 restriction endonuclease subunit S [Bacillus atrophaeus]
MSKKKKTIEELLEEALVQEEEHPYEVPRNWEWVKMGSVITLISGRDVSTKLCNSEEKGIPYIMGASNIVDNELDVERWIETPAVIGVRGDILISVKGTVGKVVIQELDEVHLSRQIMALRSKDTVLNKFLYLYIQTYIEKLKEAAKGIIPGISRDDILNAPFPLLPLNEQKRIAEKVERLLSKIDEANQLIEEAKETFELRRAAILDKAFRGELTRKWREENSLEKKEVELINGNQSIESNSPYSIPTKWKWRKLKDVASFKNGFAFKSKDFVEQGIQLVRMGNLYKNDLALDRNPVYMPLDFDEKIIEKYSVKNGDILLSLTGTKYKRDYGYAVRVEGVEKPLLLNQRILSLNPNFMDEYIFYYLQSSVFRDVFFSFETGGVNQGNVGSKAVESILIPIPPLEEAKEIEKMLNNLLKNEKETLKILNVEDKLETLKQATLSKAFRGELGTNDPSEENAIELLKEVLREQVK